MNISLSNSLKHSYMPQKTSIESRCLTGLNVDLQVSDQQSMLLRNISKQQSKLTQGNAMITAMRSQFTIEAQESKHPDRFKLSVSNDQKIFLNALFKENSLDNRLIGDLVNLEDLTYFGGQIEGWIGAGDLQQQNLSAQTEFISNQYNTQLQLIDKLINSAYEIFMAAIKNIT